MIDGVQHPLEKAEGQSPDDVAIGIAYDDTRKADFRHLRHDVFDLPRLLMETGQRKPQGLLDLRGVESEFLVLLQMEGVSRHDQARPDARVADEFVDVSEIFGVGEFDADLFEGLSGCGDPGRVVGRLHAAAGTGHMSGPRITLEDRTLDQEHLCGVAPLAQHDRDGGPLAIPGVDNFRRVGRKFPAYVFDIHVASLAASNSE